MARISGHAISFPGARFQHSVTASTAHYAEKNTAVLRKIPSSRYWSRAEAPISGSNGLWARLMAKLCARTSSNDALWEAAFLRKNLLKILSKSRVMPLSIFFTFLPMPRPLQISYRTESWLCINFSNLPFCVPTYPAMCHDESVHTGSGWAVVIPHKRLFFPKRASFWFTSSLPPRAGDADSHFSPLMRHETWFATRNVSSLTMLHPLAYGTSGMSIFEKSKISAMTNFPFGTIRP